MWWSTQSWRSSWPSSLGLVDRGLQGGDRVAGALGGGHRAGQAGLGPVVDHPAHAPDPAGEALQLAEVGLPHAIASGRRVQEHRPAGLSELAALGLVADRLQQAPAGQGPSHRGLAGLDALGGQQPQILRWPQAAHCSACLAASGSIWSTTGAGRPPGRGRSAPPQHATDTSSPWA